MGIFLQLLSLSLVPSLDVPLMGIERFSSQVMDVQRPCPSEPQLFGIENPQLSLLFRHQSHSGAMSRRSTLIGVQVSAHFGGGTSQPFCQYSPAFSGGSR